MLDWKPDGEGGWWADYPPFSATITESDLYCPSLFGEFPRSLSNPVDIEQAKSRAEYLIKRRLDEEIERLKDLRRIIKKGHI